MNIFAIGIFILCCLLSGCGFHLREPATLPPPLLNLYLQTTDPYGQTTRDLKQSLKLSGVHLAKTAQEASVILDILQEDTNQQLLSVSATQLTRQYNLILTVTFQIRDKQGNVLIPPQSTSETRGITIQANQILGGSNEANNLYQQMRLAIVYSIMNKLSSQALKTVLMKTS